MVSLKKVPFSVALIFSLSISVSAAQAETMDIPLPTEDPAIQNVVGSVKGGVDIQDLMVKIREGVMAEQVKRTPLLPTFRNAIGGPIRAAVMQETSTRVMQETSTRTINAQMNAMMDLGPGGVPVILAPKFEFEK
jgi:hypothetical protein